MEEWPQRQAGFDLAMGNGFHLLGLLCPHQLTPALPVIVPSVLGVFMLPAQMASAEHMRTAVPRPFSG